MTRELVLVPEALVVVTAVLLLLAGPFGGVPRSWRPQLPAIVAGVGLVALVLELWLGATLANLFGDAPASVCLVITDLTEQKRRTLREAMFAKEEAARAEAEAANEAKDEFLTILSHELRNPLGVILNGIEVLDRTSSLEQGPVKTRAIIRRQAQHLAKLLDDLLDMTRVSQGKIELHRQLR